MRYVNKIVKVAEKLKLADENHLATMKQTEREREEETMVQPSHIQ